MRRSVILLSVTLLSVTAVLASEKDDLLAKGMNKLTDAQIAEKKIGKSVSGTAVPKNVKWMNEYKDGGVKISTFGGKSHKRQWSFEGGKWCESAGKRLACDIEHYELDGICFIFRGDGSIAHKFECK